MKRRVFRIADDANIGSLARLLSKVTQAGKALRVTVEPWRKPRSVNQNSYLWGVVYQIIAQDTGHSPEEIHDFFKSEFCPPQEIVVGCSRRDVKTTTRLSTVEMSDYTERVIAFAATELALDIPAPNEWVA